MNLHTHVCFVYDFVYHLKQHNSWGRTKMERKEGRKTRAQVIKCILCSVFFLHLKLIQLVNISVGFPFNHAICVSIQIDLGQFCT